MDGRLSSSSIVPLLIVRINWGCYFLYLLPHFCEHRFVFLAWDNTVMVCSLYRFVVCSFIHSCYSLFFALVLLFVMMNFFIIFHYNLMPSIHCLSITTAFYLLFLFYFFLIVMNLAIRRDVIACRFLSNAFSLLLLLFFFLLLFSSLFPFTNDADFI